MKDKRKARSDEKTRKKKEADTV